MPPKIRFNGIKMRFKRNECALVFQALDALKKALRQEPLDAAVRAELHFSMGNQLREMNDLDQAFQVNLPLVYNTYCIQNNRKTQGMLHIVRIMNTILKSQGLLRLFPPSHSSSLVS